MNEDKPNAATALRCCRCKAAANGHGLTPNDNMQAALPSFLWRGWIWCVMLARRHRARILNVFLFALASTFIVVKPGFTCGETHIFGSTIRGQLKSFYALRLRPR